MVGVADAAGMEAAVNVLIQGFLADARVLTILVLLVAQILAAILVAVKTGDFDARYLADYYRERVVPYIGGTAILYILTRYLPDGALGAAGSVLNEGLFTTCWLTLVLTLAARLMTDLTTLGLPIPTIPMVNPQQDPQREVSFPPDTPQSHG